MSTRKFKKNEIDIKKNELFKKNSKYFHDDELIKYHLINKNLLEYKCYSVKCPSKNGKWKRKTMYLILNRLNNKLDDLRLENLTFYCPNCFCQEKGENNLKLFIKKKIEKKCKYCNYILNTKFNNSICIVCRERINNYSYELTSNEYAKLVSNVFDTSGNNSIEYHNEYKNIIDCDYNDHSSNKSNDYKRLEYIKTNKLSSSIQNKHNITNNIDNINNVDNIDNINLNLTINDDLKNKLNNI